MNNLRTVFTGLAMVCVVYSNAQSKVDWSKQAEKAVELVAKLPEVIKADK